MASLESQSHGIGVIFQYPEPILRDNLIDWARENGFEIMGEGGLVSLGTEGMEVKGELPQIGTKQNIGLGYNPNAHLHQFGTGAFVTLEETKGGEKEASAEIQDLLNFFDAEGVTDQIVCYEVTENGRARVGNELDLSQFVTNDCLSELEQIHGDSATCGAIRLTSDDVGEKDQDNYFKLLLDAQSANNPTIWTYKYIRRYSELDDYSKDTMCSNLHDILNLAKTDE